jgi:MFS family permease
MALLTADTGTRTKLNLVFVVFCAAVTGMGGFLFGYDTAVINGANSLLQKNFRLDVENDAFLIGLATSSAIIGCIVGAASAGFVSDRFGRRKVLFFCAVLYAVSGLLCAASWDFNSFLGARIVNGLAIGVSSMICPVYIAEISPPQWRGRLGTLFQLGIVVGIFVALFSNSFIQSLGAAYWGPNWGTQTGWRCMLLLEVLPALFFLGLLFPIPESPRWQIAVGREAAARQTLDRIGGHEYAVEELAAVRAVLREEEGSFSELFSRRYRLPLLIAVFIMFASQFSGINVIMYYSTDIFMRASKPVDAFYRNAEKAAQAVDLATGRGKLQAAIEAAESPTLAVELDREAVRAEVSALRAAQASTSVEALRAGTADGLRLVADGPLGKRMAEISSAAGKTAFACSAWLGLVNVLATFIALGLVDKLGRKPLLLAGNLIQVVGLAGAGILFYTGTVTVGSLLGMVIVYLLAFAMAMGPIPWVLCSEIFPAKMRGRAMSIATLSIWTGCFVIVQTSPALMRLSPAAAFFFYGACSLATFLFVLLLIPETKGRSLEEIEKSWQRPGG